MSTSWKSDTVYTYFSSFFSFTHITHWLDLVSLSTYIAVFYICAVVTVVPLGLVFFLAYNQGKPNKMAHWPVPVLRFSCHIFPTILFIPFLGKIPVLRI